MIQLFDKYFLVLTLIQGCVVRFIDYKRHNLGAKAKFISNIVIVSAIVLFILGKVMG